MALENYAKCKFKVYVSTDATAVAASCSTLAAFILTPKESKPKIKHCLSSVKQYQFKKYKKLICIDAATSDAENRCM